MCVCVVRVVLGPSVSAAPCIAPMHVLTAEPSSTRFPQALRVGPHRILVPIVVSFPSPPPPAPPPPPLLPGESRVEYLEGATAMVLCEGRRQAMSMPTQLLKVFVECGVVDRTALNFGGPACPESGHTKEGQREGSGDGDRLCGRADKRAEVSPVTSSRRAGERPKESVKQLEEFERSQISF